MREWIETHAPMIGVALAAIAAGAFAASVFARPAPAPIQIQTREAIPSPTTTLFVHVDGAVRAPGVYRLPSDARVFEAIEAAGGAQDEAEIGGLNLAAHVADGQKLVIPGRGTPIGAPAASAPGPDATVSPVSGLGPPASSSGATTARINVNTASQRVLESLPGIGPVTATNIIQYRQANGPFTRAEQLRDARLVSASVFDRIKDQVTV